MHIHQNTATPTSGSTRPWRSEPPAGSPWFSDITIWESLDSESVHHVPEGVVTPEMRAESIRDARPFWWAQCGHAAVALVEDRDNPDRFRVVQADSLTRLVALVRNGVEWPDFVSVSESLPWFEFDIIRDRAFRLMCAIDEAATVLQEHWYDEDPMSGRWVYRLGKRRARITALLDIGHCSVTVSGTGSTSGLVGKSRDEIRAEIEALLPR